MEESCTGTGGDMSTLKNIQFWHNVWQRKNFGLVPDVDSLLGIVEEVGELSHGFTKKRQGNRVNEDHDRDMQDAIGDIVIFLMSFCTSQGWDFEDIVVETWEEVSKRNWVRFPENGRDK
jgi:NTP pyrophosphatase (non-canonical NTP hydrolase)